jgi:peptide/nickel transport system ATP-binding protein
MSESLLEVEDLRVEFATRHGTARVLDGVSFQLERGETLGIVGESGCGKSMTALSIMGLVPSPPGRVTGGGIRLAGEELLRADEKRMREIRGNEISMIFQEPMSSLNPVYSVGDQIAETVRLHQGLGREAALARAQEMLRAVGIPAPEKRVREYPHQLSGGMRQRVMIAMALACNPSVLIADEPTTALDVTVQAQIFDLLDGLKRETRTAIILITHDMGAIAEMADRVVVMYAGRIVEQGSVDAILEQPRHPYTQGLIACVPHLDPEPTAERPPLTEIPGVVPPLTALGEGCAFAPRCDKAFEPCATRPPPGFQAGEGHRAACWLLDEGAARYEGTGQ